MVCNTYARTLVRAAMYTYMDVDMQQLDQNIYGQILVYFHDKWHECIDVWSQQVNKSYKLCVYQQIILGFCFI